MKRLHVLLGVISMVALSGLLSALPLTAVGCGTSPVAAPDLAVALPDPLAPRMECQPGTLAVKPLKGDRQMVISKLEIADALEGFDLNRDGKVDNKLSPLGGLANSSIDDAFKFQKNIVIPIELYGYQGPDTMCTKMAFFLGRWIEDRDGDGKETSWENGKSDCDDTNPMVHPGAAEDLTNRMDDDCDGWADNKPMTPPVDKMDLDGDGVTIAQGDCDDRANNPIAKMRWRNRAANTAAKDVCGNGIDEDCDGIPDNDPSCDPFGASNDQPVHVQALSFGGMAFPAVDGGTLDPMNRPPLIVFADGNVQSGSLNAGPDLFRLNLPFQRDLNVDLTLTGAHVRMDLVDKPDGTYVLAQKPGEAPHGILGGVLEAVSLAQIHIDAGGVLKKEQSLLDGIFVGPAGTILGLDTDSEFHYLPDIDADGDGLETFWQEKKPSATPDGGTALAIIDTCKDGDGTIIKNGDDGVPYCPLAKDKSGKYRFVDGLSVALKFTAVPVKMKDVTPN